MHHRTWYLENSYLNIHDYIKGVGFQLCDIRFHLAPEVHAEARTQGDIILSNKKGHPIARITSAQNVTLNIENSTWHPEFGKVVPNLCISILVKGKAPFSHVTKFEWLRK